MPSKDKATAYASRQRCEQNAKDDTIAMYGGKCKLCGLDGPRHMLTLDHIKENGADERRILRNTKAVYRRARMCYQPDVYQVLCIGCNWNKRHEMGNTGGRHGLAPAPPEESIKGWGPLFSDEDDEGAA